MKKYDEKSNVVYNIIRKAREKKKLSKSEVCRQLQLYAVYIDPTELNRIETCRMIVKDFELIALCKVLDIDFKDLEKTLTSYES